MKILIIGDLHGQIPVIPFCKFDAIIAPGDFCSDAPKKFMFQALQEHLNNKKSKTTWYDLAGKHAVTMVEKSLADGRAVLEHLNTIDTPVYVVPGNWDWTGKDKNRDPPGLKMPGKHLFKGLSNVINVNHSIKTCGDYQLIGCGNTSGPEYPQLDSELKRYTTRELRDKKNTYEKHLEIVRKLFLKARKPIIYLSHNVPYNTALDQIINPASPRNGMHWGSVIGRKIIEEFQPIVAIGGHMHEHHTSCMLGKTTCINSGYGGNVSTVLEVKGTSVKISFNN